jgi:hypothetical protein
MSDVTYSLSFNETEKLLTIIDNGSDYSSVPTGIPTSITVLIKTDDKDRYVYKFFTDNSGDIAAFLNPLVGLVITPDVFVGGVPDNFYIVEVIINETMDSQMLSERKVFTVISHALKTLEYNALSVNFPPVKTIHSIPYAMGLMMLELLKMISGNAVYTYDRENKWRKLYNGINSTIDAIKY